MPRACPLPPALAAGAIYFTADEAAKHGKNKEKVILVRKETTPEDIEGMDFSQAILTVFGGMTSHAAVVARGMGRAAVVGCGDLKINEEAKTVTVNGKTYHEGDMHLRGWLHRQRVRRPDPHRGSFHLRRLRPL